MKLKLIALFAALTMVTAIGCNGDDDEAEQEETEEENDETEEEEEAAVEEEEEVAAEEEDEEADDEVEVTVAEDGTVTIEATETDFSPSAIEAPSGEELTLEFVRETEDGCMDSVVFSDLDIEEDLPTGEAVTVTVTPEEGETIDFACGMGMGESTITGT